MRGCSFQTRKTCMMVDSVTNPMLEPRGLLDELWPCFEKREALLTERIVHAFSYKIKKLVDLIEYEQELQAEKAVKS
jgi:hypothetical protein